ncbi:hypothetical protein DEO23_09630 [Brachybacterium endophyticum]|uniref:Uncharacterized protein n=1 Tax=Brachybacterium endophyticum TaxID=2182385 RepID=A0A2U2RJT9_9MICO|nr:hypothetical protein DEO23_09630 [Brachybacterium endophyticum]
MRGLRWLPLRSQPSIGVEPSPGAIGRLPVPPRPHSEPSADFSPSRTPPAPPTHRPHSPTVPTCPTGPSPTPLTPAR